uniref:Protein kinase domain-containing protein n=1 Tax=Davidia involucrata TaxID=16924 RepID=A0A5B6ZJH3_DAVIN
MDLDASEASLTATAASGGCPYTLLHNFSASLVADYSKVPFVMREFIINVTAKFLDITFAPSLNASDAYGFVNGIEVVSIPLNLYVRGGDVPLTLVGYPSVPFYIDETFALETCYRINVGGDDIPPIGDTGMFRTWTSDEGYIFGGAFGVTPRVFNISVKYPPTVPAYTAPEEVYHSSRSMGPFNTYINMNYNLSWFFPIDSGFRYLVRLHFCEIFQEVTKANGRVFKIFINNQTAENEADVIEWSGGNGVPVYKDYVVLVPVVSMGKQDLWLELHPNMESNPRYADAILNGVEILKLSSNDGNLAGFNTPKIYSFPVEPSSKSSKNSKKIIFVITGCSLGGLMILILLCLLGFHFRIITEWTPFWSVLQLCYSKSNGTKKTNISPLGHHFCFEDIKAATSNFDEELLIGTGGFGKVYKGYINGGATIIAVKRGNPCSEQGAYEFQTEIRTLSQLRHHNLVSLIGYCKEDNEMVLVYDYMANGTLHDHLHFTQITHRSPLTWEQRLKICIGAARGLHYLHTGTKQRIIHRDVKTSNILLDENWVAKVSDFGLSKTKQATMVSHSHVSTDVKGSFGYLDPEYYKSNKLTEKSDVYSFGVVLLEVLSARPAVNPTMEDEHINLAEWGLRCYHNGTIDEITDPNLKGKIELESLAKFVEIAKDCLAERGVERPPMSEVLWNLELSLQLQSSNVEADRNIDISALAVSIGPASNSDLTPGVEFSDIMMPTGR